MKKFLSVAGIILFLILPLQKMQAQSGHDISSSKSHSKILLGADLVSRYIWRGMQFGGNSPSIQPAFTYQYKGFETGVWGAFSISGDNHSEEVDLHISQSFAKKMFTVILTDYFFPDDFADYNYFDYRNHSTGHILEGTFAYNGTQKFPLTALIATNFYGADAARIENDPNSPDFNQKTGIQYSTYFEVGYPFQIKTVAVNTFVGFNLTNPRKPDKTTGYTGETGFYGTGFGVVNVGFTASKALPITQKYALPLKVSLITNPQAGKIFFVFGISF